MKKSTLKQKNDKIQKQAMNSYSQSTWNDLGLMFLYGIAIVGLVVFLMSIAKT